MRIIVQSLRGCQKVLSETSEFLTAKKEEADLVLNYIEWRLSNYSHRVGSLTKNVEEIRIKLQELKETLIKIKNKRFSFQRLPRRASHSLNLAKLEVVV